MSQKLWKHRGDALIKKHWRVFPDLATLHSVSVLKLLLFLRRVSQIVSFRNINDSKMSAAALIVLFEKAVFMIRSRSTNKIRNSNPTEKRGQAASVAVDVCLSPPATCGQQPPCRSSGKAEEDLRTYSRVSASFFWNSSSDSWLRRFLFRRLRREIDNNNNIKSNKGIKKIVHTEVVHMQDWTGAGSHSLSSSFRSSKAPRSTRLIWLSIRWLQTQTAQTENHQREKKLQKLQKKKVCSRVKSSSLLLVVSRQVSISLQNGQNLNSATNKNGNENNTWISKKKKITKDWDKVFDIEKISQCVVTWPVISNKWPLWINSRPLPLSFILCCQGERCRINENRSNT